MEITPEVADEDLRYSEEQSQDNTDEDLTTQQEYEAFQQWWVQMRNNRTRVRKKRHGHLATGEGLSLADHILAKRKVKDDLPLGTSATHLYREEYRNRRQHSSLLKNGRASHTSDTGSDSESSDSIQERGTKRKTLNRSKEHVSVTSRERPHSQRTSHHKTTTAAQVTYSTRSHNHRSATTTTTRTRNSQYSEDKIQEQSNPSASTNKESIHRNVTSTRDQWRVVETSRDSPGNGTIDNKVQDTHWDKSVRGSDSPPADKHNRSHISQVPKKPIKEKTKTHSTEQSEAELKHTQTNKDYREKKSVIDERTVDASTKNGSGLIIIGAVNHNKKNHSNHGENQDAHSNVTANGYTNNNHHEDNNILSSLSSGEDGRMDTGYTSGNETPPVTYPNSNDAQHQTLEHPTYKKQQQNHQVLDSKQQGEINPSGDGENIVERKSKPDQYHQNNKSSSQSSTRVPAAKTSNPSKQEGSMDRRHPNDASSDSFEADGRRIPSREQETKARIKGEGIRTNDSASASNETSLGLDKANLINWGDSDEDIETDHQPSRLLPLIETPLGSGNKKNSKPVAGPSRNGVKLPHLPNKNGLVLADNVPVSPSNSPWAQQPEIPAHLKHLSNDYTPMRVSSLPEHSRNNLVHNALPPQSRRHSGPSSRKPATSNLQGNNSAVTNVDMDQMERQVDRVLGDIIHKYSKR